MIRREETRPDGQSEWVLIGQVDHAALAAALAESWGAEAYAPLVPREALLTAVRHHDDGWPEWERLPALDPATGRPLNFTEMPTADTLDIWRRSIARWRAGW